MSAYLRPTVSPLRRPIEEAISASVWRTTREIADDAGWPLAEARDYLDRMRAAGRVERDWRGGDRTWRLTDGGQR